MYHLFFNILESSGILATMKKKKEIALMNDSNDMDRAFNPFKIKTGEQANFSISALSPLDQVIYLKLLFKHLCDYFILNVNRKMRVSRKENLT